MIIQNQNQTIIFKISQQTSMSYVSDIAERLASQIVKDRRYNYSQQTLFSYLEKNPSTVYECYQVKNNRSEALDVALFYQKHFSYSKTCILYCHGLGSNKMQTMPIIDNLRHLQYHICSFDFSASGRSEGQNTTFGVREQNDVLSVLSWLDSLRKYERYILWGRSMGAASIILSQSQQLNPKIQCIILDSPFSSFQKIAFELASKKSFVPNFMIELMMDPLKKQFQKKYEFNPFNIDTTVHIKNISAKFLFIYSKNDNIVSSEHSELLKNQCRIKPFIVQINEDHNAQRNRQTFHKIINFIEESIKDNNRKKRLSESKVRTRGISITSKDKLYIDNPRISQPLIHRRLSQAQNKAMKIGNNSSSISTLTFENTTNMSTQINYQNTIPSSRMNHRQGLKKTYAINSVCQNSLTNKLNKCLEVNKENMKPAFNLIRKNRFRN